MARSKKNKVFDLFKSDFKINLFYKPTLTDGDDFYYLELDEVIRLKIKEVKGVLVIDDVIPLTTTYIKPIYEKLVRTVMAQDKLTVLVALTGNSVNIQQACVTCDCPIVDDIRYTTVSPQYYTKLKSVYGDDKSKYGFYILAVHEGTDEPDESVVKVSDLKGGTKEEKTVNNTPIGVEPPISQIARLLKTELKAEFKSIQTEELTKDSIAVILNNDQRFVVEIAEGGIYIKELLQSTMGDGGLNLIKLMNLVTTFQKLLTIHENVYIISVQNAELSSLCRAKGFINIQEEQKLPMNHLFRQAFHGYGSFQIV